MWGSLFPVHLIIARVVFVPSTVGLAGNQDHPVLLNDFGHNFGFFSRQDVFVLGILTTAEEQTESHK